jgi:hypothetical protein
MKMRKEPERHYLSENSQMQKAPARPARVKPQVTVEDAMYRLRQAVIRSQTSPDAAAEGDKAVALLNELYAYDKDLFTAEDIRFANVLRGYLGERLAAHKPKKRHTMLAKRKGDKLDHCWRCQTLVDERFTENCPECSEKAYQWRICPVCNACGCQRANKVLI